MELKQVNTSRYDAIVFLKQNKTKDHWPRGWIRKCVSESLQEVLSVAIDADVHLPPVDLGSVHDPARVVGALWTVKPHRPAAL